MFPRRKHPAQEQADPVLDVEQEDQVDVDFD
mgnify:CR=1 FL=1